MYHIPYMVMVYEILYHRLCIRPGIMYHVSNCKSDHNISQAVYQPMYQRLCISPCITGCVSAHVSKTMYQPMYHRLCIRPYIAGYVLDHVPWIMYPDHISQTVCHKPCFIEPTNSIKCLF